MNITFNDICLELEQIKKKKTLLETTNLYNEMNSFINENIVELDYNSGLYTEANNGESKGKWYEEIWNWIKKAWSWFVKMFQKLFGITTDNNKKINAILKKLGISEKDIEDANIDYKLPEISDNLAQELAEDTEGIFSNKTKKELHAAITLPPGEKKKKLYKNAIRELYQKAISLVSLPDKDELITMKNIKKDKSFEKNDYRIGLQTVGILSELSMALIALLNLITPDENTSSKDIIDRKYGILGGDLNNIKGKKDLDQLIPYFNELANTINKISSIVNNETMKNINVRMTSNEKNWFGFNKKLSKDESQDKIIELYSHLASYNVTLYKKTKVLLSRLFNMSDYTFSISINDLEKTHRIIIGDFKNININKIKNAWAKYEVDKKASWKNGKIIWEVTKLDSFINVILDGTFNILSTSINISGSILKNIYGDSNKSKSIYSLLTKIADSTQTNS